MTQGDDINILKRALEREKASRKAAEKILEEKSAELYKTTQKLEKLVKEKTSELKGVFENIVDAYVVMDLWGNVLKMNDAAVNLLGYDNAVEDFNLTQLADVSEVDNVMNAFKILVKEGSITNFQVKINTKDKTQKLVHINASIIVDDKNNIIAAQGIVRDITLENQYQKAVEAEKQKYSNIIANMKLGLVEVNRDDEILMVNQSFSEMSGYTEAELLGKKGSDIFQSDGVTNIIKKEHNKRLKGQSNSYELKVKNKAGENRHWLISGAPNYDIKSDIIGSIGIHLDITDLKNLELATLEKMEQLISDILNYSSVISDNHLKTPVNLQDIVTEVIDMIYVPEHIEINVLNPLPTVSGDDIKLLQVFQNLISNAIKFNDKDKGIINIDVCTKDNHYEFSIEDNGIGIASQFHDKIFQIFHVLNKRKDSTGIGLSIVKKIINLHDGTIWLESTPNIGTKFFFTLKK